MLLSNYKFINGFNYKCASIEEGGQSLKMWAVCLQTLTSLGAIIGDIRYQNLDQRAGSTPSTHVLLVNKRQNASRTTQEMCSQGQEQLIWDEAESNFDATDHKDSHTSAHLNKEPVEHMLNDLAYVSFIRYCSFLFCIIHALL